MAGAPEGLGSFWNGVARGRDGDKIQRRDEFDRAQVEADEVRGARLKTTGIPLERLDAT